VFTQNARTASDSYSLRFACRALTEEAKRHTVALQLPPEVWNKVFACLKLNCKQLDESVMYEMVTQQAQLHKLRLVCTKFNKVIEQHTELLDQLLLRHVS
jgi:hypothetical protein